MIAGRTRGSLAAGALAAALALAAGACAPSRTSRTAAGAASPDAANPPASAHPGATAGPGARLLWSDEFNGPAGSTPDPSNWAVASGPASGSAESECYTPRARNVSLDGHGDLVLTARREPSCGGMPYSSGRIETAGHRTFRYGYLEMRAKLPTSAGALPAFWLLGADLPRVGWPRSGETDIAEVSPAMPDAVRTSVDGLDANGGPWESGWGAPGGTYRTPANLGNAFHTYGLDWTPDRLTFYVDGTRTREIDKSQVPVWLWDQDNYLVLSLAVVDPGATAGPLSMVVDYIRAYSAYPGRTRTATPAPSRTTSPPATGDNQAATRADIPGTWTLAFHDEFDGQQLDLTRWQLCNPSFRASCVPYNNEQEIFNTTGSGRNANVEVSGGQLHLIATRDAHGQIHSGMVSTGPWPATFGPRPAGYTGFSYTYGYYEGRVRVPKGNGYWPSLWELPWQQEQGGKGWPDTGEYDTFEIPGNDPTQYHFTAHWGGPGGTCGHPCSHQEAKIADASTTWHTYGLDWEPTGLTWYVDGTKMGHTVTTPEAIKNYPFYIIANLSVGGIWPPLHAGVDATTPFPASMDIDWLRVYQHPPAGH